MDSFIPVLPYNLVTDFFALNARALWFTLAISLLTGVVFGLAPAWHASNPEIVPVLKGDLSTGEVGKRRRFTLRNALVVAQVVYSGGAGLRWPLHQEFSQRTASGSWLQYEGDPAGDDQSTVLIRRAQTKVSSTGYRANLSFARRAGRERGAFDATW